MTLDELLTHAAEFAAVQFNAMGEVMPMWVGVTDKGERIGIVTAWNNVDDKDKAAAKVRQEFKARNVVQYAFMAEAWVLIAGRKDITDEDLRRISREHEDRRECIQIAAENKTEIATAMYFILRPEHGKATLSPLKKFPTQKKTEFTIKGRMVGLMD